MAGKAIKKLWDRAMGKSTLLFLSTLQGQLAIIGFSFFKKLDFFLFRSYLIYTGVYGTHEVINFICNFIVHFII